MLTKREHRSYVPYSCTVYVLNDFYPSLWKIAIFNDFCFIFRFSELFSEIDKGLFLVLFHTHHTTTSTNLRDSSCVVRNYLSFQCFIAHIFTALSELYFKTMIFSERELRYMLSPVRLSSVCLSSVTSVRATQAVQIFGNISTALALAIR